MALDFPSLSEIPLQNPANEFSPTSTPKSSTNGLTYIWNGQSWDLKIVDNSGGGGGGISEAPVDNFAYNRKNAAWERAQVVNESRYIANDDPNNQTMAGPLTVNGKVSTPATQSGDSTTTLTTKGYVDGQNALYLKLDGSNSPVTGEVTFNEEVDFKQGIDVVGGQLGAGFITNGIVSDDSLGFGRGMIMANNYPDNHYFSLLPPGNKVGVRVTPRVTNITDTGFTGFQVYVKQPSAGGTIGNSVLMDIRPAEQMFLTSGSKLTYLNLMVGDSDIDHAVTDIDGIQVSSTVAKGIRNRGVVSNFSAVPGEDNYNFYAGGDAANYFEGEIQCQDFVRAKQFVNLTGEVMEGDRVFSAAGDMLSDFSVYGLRYLPTTVRHTNSTHTTQRSVGVESNYNNLTEAPNANALWGISSTMLTDGNATGDFKNLVEIISLRLGNTKNKPPAVPAGCEMWSVMSAGDAPSYFKGEIRIAGADKNNPLIRLQEDGNIIGSAVTSNGNINASGQLTALGGIYGESLTISGGVLTISKNGTLNASGAITSNGGIYGDSLTANNGVVCSDISVNSKATMTTAKVGGLLEVGNISHTSTDGGGAYTVGVRNSPASGKPDNGMIAWGDLSVGNGDVDLRAARNVKANGSVISTFRTVDSSAVESEIADASSIVKLLQPKVMTTSSGVSTGFNFSNLEEKVAEATTNFSVVEDEVAYDRQGYDQSRLVPLLTKALQEALARLDAAGL